MKSDYIWTNGELVPYEQATVHFLSPALHYGLAVFEGIRCYDTDRGPAVFRLNEHIDRLVNSVHAFGIRDFPYSREELSSAVHQTICANQFTSCYIRPLVYMVDGPLGLNLDTSQTAVSIATWEWGALLGEESKTKGVRMMVSSFTRLHPNVNLTKAKVSGNYVNSVMAKTLAVRSGFDEAVMLDPEGFVAECTGENLFVVRNGKIYTPSKATILEGITRDAVVTIAQDSGFEVIEEPITRDQLYIADEVFVCGTAAEVVPVSEIDFRTIGDGKAGPITIEIQQAFTETILGRGKRSDEWLSFVSLPVTSMGI
ncbi:MAG: branched-chain amino acid transaminase [Gammaproteobacteria bacterium]|nr:branched-chain amino acid transaminase [Gammaproteobacteria bacterium]NIW46544.1 branched-chain amino acid transaminase [Gammaproteobacteria bacterium]NIX57573.1 branched-chain amino acid transaminase [candidate division Zixibacteria bacterium]